MEDIGQSNPLPLMLEGRSKSLGRNYVLIYNEAPGTYTQRFPHVPDGQWYIDEAVTDQKIGVYTGQELRQKELEVTYAPGFSPLKIYRLMPTEKTEADWIDTIRSPHTP